MMEWFLVFGGLGLGVVGATTEVASSAADQVELYRWITERSAGAKSARALLSAPSRIVGSARGMAAVGALTAGVGLQAILEGLSPFALGLTVVFLVVPMFVTVLHSLPIAVGRRWAESTIRATVPWVSRLAAIFSPALPHDSTVRPRADLTQRQLERTTGESTGSEDLAMVSGVLAFTERQVREVMTPRIEVKAVSENTALDEVCRTFVESGFSRLPLFSDSLDDIVGFYYAFDLLKLAPGGQLPVRPVAVVPLTRPCADLLFEMQRDRRQVAVVLDEYGGTAGIATLNDLLASLVEETFEAADVQVAGDVPQPVLVEVAGTATLTDVAQRFGASLPDDPETIGGLLSNAVGRIPAVGERFELAGLEFDIVAATATRVERVAIRRAAVEATRLEAVRAP